MKPYRPLAMAGYDRYLVGIIDSQMGVYEDEKVCYSLREGECGKEECPSMGICVEDDD